MGISAIRTRILPPDSRIYIVTGIIRSRVIRQTDSTGKTPALTVLPRSLPTGSSDQTMHIPGHPGPGPPHRPPSTDTPAPNNPRDPNA